MASSTELVSPQVTQVFFFNSIGFLWILSTFYGIFRGKTGGFYNILGEIRTEANCFRIFVARPRCNIHALSVPDYIECDLGAV